jgi:hypothetical protein
MEGLCWVEDAEDDSVECVDKALHDRCKGVAKLGCLSYGRAPFWGGKILNRSRRQIFFFVLDGEEGSRLARHMMDAPTKVILSIDSLPNESDWMKDNLDKYSPPLPHHQ